jgi:hypothetical protein
MTFRYVRSDAETTKTDADVNIWNEGDGPEFIT